MPEVTFTNQQTVHVTHALGAAHPPVYVEAEGFQRVVEISYGVDYFDVLFGRVMTAGLVSYGTGGSGTVIIGTPGSINMVEHGGTGNSASLSVQVRQGSKAGRAASTGPGNPASGSFTIN